MNILDSLKENNSVQLNKSVSTWEEAIKLLFKPLEENGAVKPEYSEAIISRTNEIGPFYVIGPGIAMPHERGELGALKDAFTFMTLDKMVEFPGDEQVDILVGFAASDSEVHIAEAIPQIVMLFEDEESFDKIRGFKTKDELFEYIQNVLG